MRGTTRAVSARETPPALRGAALVAAAVVSGSSYLVDPASSHMLVSKIKPCMSKYTPLHG